ncbi:MAG: nucleotidyltransferase domain-containing protein [Trebonia sp.]
MDLNLRPERRDQLAARLRAELESFVPGSVTLLRGSLAAGTADPYSDIDLCWVVADEAFAAAVTAAAGLRGKLPSIRAVRMDPGLASSDRRRLVFIRLAGVPLFWRVDLDIRARSIAEDDSYDDGNPLARDTTGWSRPASAIENAIAAIKSGVRCRTDVTDGLLRRGYQRIGLVQSPDSDLTEQITRLAESCARLEPGLTSIANEVREVAEALLVPPHLDTRGLGKAQGGLHGGAAAASGTDPV